MILKIQIISKGLSISLMSLIHYFLFRSLIHMTLTISSRLVPQEGPRNVRYKLRVRLLEVVCEESMVLVVA